MIDNPFGVKYYDLGFFVAYKIALTAGEISLSSMSFPNKKPCLGIIVPCFNEQAMLPHTLNILFHTLTELILKQKINEDSFIYCVDDGSADQTWAVITEWHERHSSIKGLKLSRNFGHQNAVLAGMLSVKNKVDCAITIDADLQDDIAVLETMVDHFHAGDDIVSGVRRARSKDSFFKRMSALAFYKTMKISGAEIIPNHADFRLLSKRVLNKLGQYQERNLFLRGIFPLMGYRNSMVYYDRNDRLFGSTKYPLNKMLALAWDAITSFSHKPLDFILLFGTVSFLLSLLMIVWVIFAKFLSHSVPGWASIMIPLCFMGGVQLLSIGILGEYIAKIYLEVKRRPRFIKEQELL